MSSIQGKTMPLAVLPKITASLTNRLIGIGSEIRSEYLESHNYPWIVGFSGGKDSTLMLQLMLEVLLDLAPCDRRRVVHVVSNDTLVESPVLMDHIVSNMRKIKVMADNLGLPVVTAITKPVAAQSFWVNLIGRGYPTPKQNFRWCTDRMKIEPTSKYIRELTVKTGRSILLLGVREQESSARAAATRKFDKSERLHAHVSLKGCSVFRPILDLSTEEVWLTLLQRKRAAWGSSFRDLVTLYRNADGGECPTVTDKSESAACGTSSARFGCWTCTVVKKDRSLSGLIEAGFENLEPLLDFRDWLVSIRDDATRRTSVRRNGRAMIDRNDAIIPGPFTLRARREILSRLREASRESGRKLISDEEIAIIRGIWADDAMSRLGSIIERSKATG